MGLFSNLFGNSGGNAAPAPGKGGAGSSPLNMKSLLKEPCGFNASAVQPFASLVQRDPDFSEGEVAEKVSNWFIRMMDTWSMRKFEQMEPLFSPELYAKYANRLQAITNADYANYIDNPTMLNMNLDGWYEANGMEYIGATLSTRMIDTTYDRNNNIVAGVPGKEDFVRMRWVLCRVAGTKTQKAGAISTVNCPNCAAALQINKTSYCPYCGSVVNVNKSDWVVCGIQELDRRS